MASPVYSTLFLQGWVNSVASAQALAYTVPAGKLAVVRSIDIVTDAVGLFYVSRQAGGFTTFIESTQGLVAGQARHWAGNQVFPAGQLIRTSWVAGSHNVNVSGFLLSVQ